MRKYQTILADPPWQYRDTARFKKYRPKMGVGAVWHYDTMATADICNLKIPADKNCILFLWVTTPFLPDGFKVMEAWGFKYKTSIYWRKIMSLGLGHWFRGQVEVCLVGIKGHIKAFHCQKCNVIQSKVRRHSQKPEELFDLIEPYCPAPRLEMFSRARRKGWSAWGNEIKSDIRLS